MSRRSAQRKRHTQREQKVNPIYQGMTVIDGITQPRSMPRNYKSYAREGYGANDTLFKCINYALINGAAISPILYTDKSQVGKPDGKRIDKHPLLDLLNKPNNEQTGIFFRKSVIGYFLISGNAFVYANRIAKSGPPDELWTLPPDRVKPIPDQTRGIIGYEYEDWPKEKNPIPPQLIGHIRSWNPEDPFFGLSPVQVAAIMIDQQTDARKWNLSLFQNFLKPPGAWTTTALLSPNDRSKLEARVNEKFAGFRNAGKVPVLDGALEWKSSAVNPSEMDWIESMKYNSGGIANVYNMPPQLIGDTSSTTYDNFQQAEVISYTEYIFPTLDDIYDNWNTWLVPMYPDIANGPYLYYDKESVEVIQEVLQARKDAQSDRANKMWMSGMGTLNEMREKCGLQALGSDGDVFRFGAVLVAKSALGDYAEQSLTTPAAPPSPMPEPIQTQPGQPLTNEDKPNVLPPNNNNDSHANNPNGNQQQNNDASKRRNSHLSEQLYSTKALDLTTAEEKAAYVQSMEATRKKYETHYSKELASYFESERKAVTSAISSGAIGAAAGRAEGVINDNTSKLNKILLALYEDVATDVGKKIASALSDKKANVTGLQFSESQIKYLLQLAGTKVQQIDATTLEQLRSELAIGVSAGEGITDLAKRIDTLYLEQIIPNRSTTIAQTETHGAGSYAAIETAKQSGMALNKVWMTTSSKPRPTHADADGQEVGMDEPFIVGGVEMQQPGDPTAPASEVVNCRCVPYFRRAQVQDMTEDEKSIRRDEYRRFMEVALR